MALCDYFKKFVYNNKRNKKVNFEIKFSVEEKKMKEI